MQKLKQEIFKTVQNPTVIQYLQKNIFKGSQQNHNLKNDDGYIINSFKKDPNQEDVNQLIDSIQKKLFLGGIQSKFREIQKVKKKIQNLKRHTTNKQTKDENLRNPNNNEGQKNQFNFKEEKRSIKQKIDWLEKKNFLIEIVKKTEFQREKIHLELNKKNDQLVCQIFCNSVVLDNMLLQHPNKNQLLSQIDQKQAHYDEKSILIQNQQDFQQSRRLLLEIQLLQRNIQELEKNTSLLSEQKEKKEIQKKKIQQTINKNQQRIKRQNKQKELLYTEISEFNSSFEEQRKKNQQLKIQLFQKAKIYPNFKEKVLKQLKDTQLSETQIQIFFTTYLNV